MLEIMDTTGAPTILTGDMNADVAWPDAAEIFDPLLETFADAWAEKGIGNGNSYPADAPNRRIDYILTTPSTIDVVNAFMINSKASDHWPMVADLIVHGPIPVYNPETGSTTRPTKPAVWTNPYHDVAEGAWYYDAVRFVTEKELFGGVPGGGFAPNVIMSRAMLVTVLHRLAGEPEAGSASFADVADGRWYADAVKWAAANGIVKGTGNGLFDPDGNVTREQIAVILYQYAKLSGTLENESATLDSYADSASVSAWASDAMGWAVKQGLITGKPGNLLDPSDSATRAEVAMILMRFINR